MKYLPRIISSLIAGCTSVSVYGASNDWRIALLTLAGFSLVAAIEREWR